MIAPVAWTPADGLSLEPNARHAAMSTSGCLALTAGPGAGKTEMLAQRADFLLRTNTCPYPRRILAISFKTDASRNLKERVQKRSSRALSSRFDSYTFHAFAKQLIDRFRQLLTGNDALNADYTIGETRVAGKQITFNDMVPLGLEILRTSDMARNVVQGAYSDVFLDEFQDCTEEQYALIKEAFLGKNVRLVAVGDTKQKIMGWAGAVDGIFTDFVRDFPATPLNMYQNFRSDPVIRRMHNAMVRGMDPPAAVADDDIVGDEGTIRVLGFTDSTQEAQALAETIASWIEDDGVAPSEIAILGAKTPAAYAEKLAAQLEGRGIQLRDEQAVQDLYTEPVVQLMADYLLISHGKREPEAWSRLSGVLDFLASDSPSHHGALRGAFALKPQADSQFTAASMQERTRAFLVLIGADYVRSLAPHYENGNRLGQLTREFFEDVERHSSTPEEMTRYLRTSAQVEAVRLLSIHKCKGLEFDKVIIIAVENEMFWGDPAAERCAFFVGISRARHELVLTHCRHRSRPTSAKGRWTEIRTPQKEFLGYAEGLHLERQ